MCFNPVVVVSELCTISLLRLGGDLEWSDVETYSSVVRWMTPCHKWSDVAAWVDGLSSDEVSAVLQVD